MSQEVKGYDRGSVLDMALLLGGDIECAMSLCVENGLCLSDDLESGRMYSDCGLENVNPEWLKQIRQEGIKPATALSDTDRATCPYGGIGFMGIEIDFEIS